MQVLEAPTDNIRQRTDYYCGAACSQMLIAREGMRVSQDELYRVIQNKNSEPDAFYSDPDGIIGLLNSPEFDPFHSGEIVVVDQGSDPQIADRIFDNIFDNKIPSVCLINSGNHWVVCHKLIYDLNENRNINLVGVFLLDPWPSSPPEIYVPIKQFLSDILNPNAFGVKWKGKRVFLAGSKSNLRKISVALTSQTPAKGGGAAAPDPKLVVANLKKIGVAQVKRPKGGGAQPLRVTDLYDGSIYYIAAYDALEDKIFNGIIHVAVGADSQVLEVTIDRGQPFFASDVLVEEAIRSDLGEGGYEIDPQLYWKRNSILRNRFVVARRARKEDKEIWILPTGDLVHSLDFGIRGGR